MLDTPHFDNRFTRELPADLQSANFRHQVYGVCYSRVAPTPVASPRLITYAPEVAELLDTTPATCASPEFVQVFSDNKLLHLVVQLMISGNPTRATAVLPPIMKW